MIVEKLYIADIDKKNKTFTTVSGDLYEFMFDLSDEEAKYLTIEKMNVWLSKTIKEISCLLELL